MGPWSPEIFSFLGAPKGIGAPRVKGPRKVAPNKGPMQTRGSYRQGPLQIKGQGAHTYKGPLQTNDPYRRCVIPTNKGPLQTNWSPYRQLRALIDNQGPLLTRGPYRRFAIPTGKGPIHTRGLYRQGVHTDRGLYGKGPLWTLCNSYRQGALTNRSWPLQTIRGPYRQEAPT